MADFTTVIRRAVEGLPDNTPELRARVYEKARAAVVRQMENMNPRPPEALVKRQINKIDAAITEVEAEFTEALPPVESDGVPILPDEGAGGAAHVAEYSAFTEGEEPDEGGAETALLEEAVPQNYDGEGYQRRDTVVDDYPAFSTADDETHTVADANDPHSAYDYMAPYEKAPSPFDKTPVADEGNEQNLNELPYGGLYAATFEPGYTPPNARRDEDAKTDYAFEREELTAGATFEEHEVPVEQTGVSAGFNDIASDDGQQHFRASDDWQPDVAHRPAGGFEPAPPPPRRLAPEKDWAHVDSLLGLDQDDDDTEFDYYDSVADDEIKGHRLGVSGVGSKKRLIAALGGLCIVFVLVIGGYFAWTSRDMDVALTSASDGVGSESETASANPETSSQNESKNTQTAEPNSKPFTQRLLPDGNEVDEGLPALSEVSGPARSVANQTSASIAPTPSDQNTADPSPPIGASQRMYLYEEQLGQSDRPTFEGTVEWNLKQQNNGTDVSEPIIEGVMSVPDAGLSGVITFRRNDDPSLPASHLIDIAFDVTDDFSGGAVESVQRISMKPTEAAGGDELIAVSAKITDDLYMLALNDFDKARAQNLALMRDRDWIDIPVTYRNGRRALLTLEKGTTGMAIFDRAIQEWQALGDISNN